MAKRKPAIERPQGIVDDVIYPIAKKVYKATVSRPKPLKSKKTKMPTGKRVEKVYNDLKKQNEIATWRLQRSNDELINQAHKAVRTPAGKKMIKQERKTRIASAKRKVK